jgi:hypothetical protein
MNILAPRFSSYNKVGDSHLAFQAWRCQPGSPEAQWDQGHGKTGDAKVNYAT